MENGLERAVGKLLPKPRQAPPQLEPRRGGWADVRKNMGSGSTDPGRGLLGLFLRERLTLSIWDAKQGT